MPTIQRHVDSGTLIATISRALAHPFSLRMINKMKLRVVLLILLGLSSQAYASGTDADLAAIKAQEKAAKESDAAFKAKETERKRQEVAFKKKQDAQTAGIFRPQLGKAAEGKSDEEVIRMYELKVKQDDKKKPDEAAIRAKSDAQSRSVTGKSLKDMQDMSDADMDKVEAALLKKYKQ